MEALQEHWYKFNKWFRSYSTGEKIIIVFLLLALASIPPSLYLALHPIDLRNFAQTPITPPGEITPTLAPTESNNIDPQTGEYYDLWATSTIETIVDDSGGTVYLTSSRLSILGQKTDGVNELHGFIQTPQPKETAQFSFSKKETLYPKFEAENVMLDSNGCIDLHSSTTPDKTNYIGTFCYTNTTISKKGEFRIYSPAANPFFDSQYSGENAPFTIQVLSTVFDKYKRIGGYNGPIMTRNNYFSIDKFPRNEEFKVTYTFQGITDGLDQQQEYNLCARPNDNAISPIPIKYMQQGWLPGFGGGGSYEEFQEILSASCTMTLNTRFRPGYLKIYMKGGLPIPTRTTPTPTPTPFVPTVTPEACKTGVKSLKVVDYCKNRTQYKKVQFVCRNGYSSTLQGQCKVSLYWFREVQKACKNVCAVTPTPTIHL